MKNFKFRRLTSLLFLEVTFFFFFNLFHLNLHSFPVNTQTSGRIGEVVLKKIEPFVYFSLKKKGSFDIIDTIINQLIESARSQNVYPAGPLLTLFHGDLTSIDPENMEWEVGFPVTPQALIQAPLERKVWEFSLVVSCVHIGPFEKIGETIQKMLEWMEVNGYVQVGPLVERSIEAEPSKFRPENLYVELWIPCKKKTE
ncbi:MAG: GyrI-like domain-containing protein [Candidatus Aminicenantes bacterium]|nr:GyrI-like domain-containing protein [Candidatus Aminicenantes bacterium]